MTSLAYPVQYTVWVNQAHTHLIDVTLHIAQPKTAQLTLSLPNWIPGSYLIRDFAKHLNCLKAMDSQGKRLDLQALSSALWQINDCKTDITLSYQVYAWDLSVRGAHFDDTHAFFNGTSVFLKVHEYQDQPCQISIPQTALTQSLNWHIATTLPRLDVDATGFGQYQAKNYRDLIEYPVEMGTFLALNFEACGIPHRVALTGKFERAKLDTDRLIQDLIKICETELTLFKAPYPFNEYLFQVMVTGDGYGGLEHTNSTALLCSRDNLPYLNDDKKTDSYLQFLELCSHEYFHSWNVKRIKPEVYRTAQLDKPVYTNQLWWFEGITSYYDGLFLNQAGLVNSDDYLNRLAKEMTRVYRMPGRFQQSVADSSYHTWTKFYQQDENAPNSIISYYTKGSLIALGLDLTIRAETQNKQSLNDVLLHLWQHKGLPNIGLDDFEIEQICSDVTGIDFSPFFQKYLYGTEDIPFHTLFKPFGIDFILRSALSATDLGGSTSKADSTNPQPALTLGANLKLSANHTLQVTHVWNEQAANLAGIAAGDELIALNGYKMTSVKQLETLLSKQNIGDTLSYHTFRRDELISGNLTLLAPIKDRVELIKTDKYDELSWLTESKGSH